MKKMLFFLLSLTLAIAASAQGSAGDNIFVEDFDFFIGKLQETHPDPYTAYGGRIKFYEHKQLLREELREVSDTLEFVNKVRGFLSLLKDGHTFLSSGSSNNNTDIKLFPVIFGIAMDGIYIREAPEDYEALLGKKLEAVNGIPVGELLERMSRLSAAENKYWNYRNLVNQLHSDRGAEKILDELPASLNLIAGGSGGTVDMSVDYREEQYKSNDKGYFDYDSLNRILFTKLLPGAGYIRWNSTLSRELMEASHSSGDDTRWLFDWAYMFLGGEPTGDYATDIEKIPYLYKSVAELLAEMDSEGVNDIIIDLRFNTGGMTPLIYGVIRMLYGDAFLEKKQDAKYGSRLSPMLLEKRGYASIEDYNARNGTDYLTGDFLFDNFSPNGYLPLEELRQMPLYNGYGGVGAEWVEAGMKLLKPYNVYVLVGPRTFSAAHHFAYMLSEMGAKLVGVTPGQAGNSFMEATYLTLPNTGLRGSVSNSWQLMYPDDPVRGEEMTPDHPMYIGDYIKFGLSRDAELDKALEVISN